MNEYPRLLLDRQEIVSAGEEAIKAHVYEDYASGDRAYLAQFRRDGEIRFGPAFYRVEIYRASGEKVLDFGARRFLSCAGYGPKHSQWTGPWSAVAPYLALPELLHRNPRPGSKISRLNIFDVKKRKAIAYWDFESVVTHKMWGANGFFYLFRDVNHVYSYSMETSHLASVSDSSSPYCFLVAARFVCIVEPDGRVSLVDARSADVLAERDIAEDGCSVYSAWINAERTAISVALKAVGSHDVTAVLYTVSVGR